MSNSKITARIAFLDYLRIFAFVSVLIGHKYYPALSAAAANNKLHATLRLFFEYLMPFVYSGGAGIIIFFLVSGYIISEVLASEQPTSFLIRRVFRIYPLYITAVLIQIIVQNRGESLSLSVLVPQLLLMGDFFGSPYTLGGVEWTLRVEIMFYVFMAMLRAGGFWGERKNWLIMVLLITTMLMSQLPVFPEGPYQGYFFIYAPFLFLGVGFWLYEKETINFGWLLTLICTVFVNYFYLISSYQPYWLPTQFAVLGFLLFTLTWIFRARFQSTKSILLLSDLTYSVYLFHKWMFDYFRDSIIKILPSIQSPDILALVPLFIFCFVLHRIIERPANKFGRAITIKHFKEVREAK